MYKSLLLLLLLLGLGLAACGSEGVPARHSLEVAADGGKLAFELRMNGCYFYDAFLTNRSGEPRGGISATLTAVGPGGASLGSAQMTFPATRAGGTARAQAIAGTSGIFAAARTARRGDFALCKDATYSLEYYGG